MPGFPFRHAIAALPVLALLAAGPSGAVAQTEPGMLRVDAIDSTPMESLAAQLMQVRNRPSIDKYLRAGGAPPEVVARRAAALIGQLAASRATLSPGQLIGAVDQVSHVAARSLSFASVIQLAVASDFRPDGAAIAWDFGPKDGTAMAGFERVPPDDRRLAGVGVAALRHGDGNPLLADGIAGLRRIELELPDGDYRIILMTQNLGLEKLTGLPFGAQVRVNGIPLIVDRRDPGEWTRAALLTRSGLRAAGAGYRRMGGHLIGEFADEVGTLYSAEQGGALVIEGRAVKGRIVIELGGFDNGQSYLTGLIAEPADRVSDLILSEEARRSLLPRQVRIALESEILLAAAEAVQGVAPAAGQVLESSDVVTPN